MLDLDLKTRNGRTLPVRLFHRLAFGADGRPGASRTLVLNRARDDGTDPQRAAEIRFMRFFHHTPMAIATVDRDGGIVRTNSLFARLFHTVLSGEGDRSIGAVVAARDRAALDAAIAQAALGKGDIAPVDAALAGEPATSVSGASTSLRSKRPSATRKPPSSMRSRPPRSASWRPKSPSSRRWSSSASSPAASRTISTMCSPPS